MKCESWFDADRECPQKNEAVGAFVHASCDNNEMEKLDIRFLCAQCMLEDMYEGFIQAADPHDPKYKVEWRMFDSKRKA